MDMTQYVNTAMTVIITMVVTIIGKAIMDWGLNKNGKNAISLLTSDLKRLDDDFSHFKNESSNLNMKFSDFLLQFKKFEGDYQIFKTDDLGFKNSFLQELNEFKHEYIKKKDYETHISSCGTRVNEYKDVLYEIKQELAVLQQRVKNIEK